MLDAFTIVLGFIIGTLLVVWNDRKASRVEDDFLYHEEEDDR